MAVLVFLAAAARTRIVASNLLLDVYRLRFFARRSTLGFRGIVAAGAQIALVAGRLTALLHLAVVLHRKAGAAEEEAL